MLFIILASVQSAHAFDNSRNGFFISVDVGAHTTSSNVSTSDSRNGLALTFKIGGGFTDKFVLYYVGNTSWYDDEYTFALGVAGTDASYFFGWLS